MLYLIGLGLNERGISKEGLLAIEKCSKVYLENYTVDFPYDVDYLKLGKDVVKLDRGDVEGNKLIKEAKGKKVALLVYGSPLFATTHMSLLLDASRAGVRTKVIYSASVFDGLAETGLQLYKFGKIASMPAWKKSYEPDSFLEIVEDNIKIKAHSLILVDIGLSFKKAILQLDRALKNKKIDIDKIVVCSNIGTEGSRIKYEDINKLKDEEFDAPFCFVVPGEMHFLEKDSLFRFG
jgi:diphthine synthase